MSTGAVASANHIQGDLAMQLLNGPQQQADLAVNIAKTEMAMQLKAQEISATQSLVAGMTGVGGNLNMVV